MKSLRDTFLFEMQDKSSGLKDRMLTYSPAMDKLGMEEIQESMDVIQKRFTFPLKNKVVDDVVTKGRVVPIFNKERIKVPTFVPAYLYSHEGRVVSLVNLTNYGMKSKEGEFIIDTRQLFACLQTGSVLLGCFERWNSISMNQTVSKVGAEIYSKIFSKVLDKMFAVNLDPIKADKVKFITAKFFLINLLGKTNAETVNNTAYACCSNGTTKGTILSFENSLDPNAYSRLDEFIKAITLTVEGTHSLTIRTFLDTYIKMYGTSAIFALEFFPYFCHMVFSVAVGAHLNSEYQIENIIGKDLDRFYNEVANIIR